MVIRRGSNLGLASSQDRTETKYIQVADPLVDSFFNFQLNQEFSISAWFNPGSYYPIFSGELLRNCTILYTGPLLYNFNVNSTEFEYFKLFIRNRNDGALFIDYFFYRLEDNDSNGITEQYINGIRYTVTDLSSTFDNKIIHICATKQASHDPSGGNWDLYLNGDSLSSYITLEGTSLTNNFGTSKVMDYTFDGSSNTRTPLTTIGTHQTPNTTTTDTGYSTIDLYNWSMFNKSLSVDEVKYLFDYEGAIPSSVLSNLQVSYNPAQKIVITSNNQTGSFKDLSGNGRHGDMIDYVSNSTNSNIWVNRNGIFI